MSRYVIDKTALIENVHYLQKKAGDRDHQRGLW